MTSKYQHVFSKHGGSTPIEPLKERLPQQGSDGSCNEEELKETVKRLSIALEGTARLVSEVAYYVRQSVQSISCLETLQVHATYIVLPLPRKRLNIFNILIERDGHVTSKELSVGVRADHLLLIGLTRFLAATVTRHLTVPNLEARVLHTYDLVCMSVMQLDPSLARTRYQHLTDQRHCPWQYAYGTEEDLFELFPHHPVYWDSLIRYITGQESAGLIC